MTTRPLPRFLETDASRVADARRLEQIVRDTGADLRDQRAQHTAADGHTLRGIPAIGRGVTGAIDGTVPGADLTGD